MKKDKSLNFSFPKTILATNIAHFPEDNPIRHTLAEEPLSSVLISKNKNNTKTGIQDENS